MTLETCTDTLIGITRDECPCYSEIPEDFNVTVSDTGIYLEDVLSLDTIRDSDCTGGDNLWTLANRAIRKAYKDVETDLKILISAAGSGMVNSWYGYIGKTKSDRTNLNITKPSGMSITPKVIGGALTIDKVSIWLDATETVTLNVLRSDTGLKYTRTIEAIANTWNETELSPPITFTKTLDDPNDLKYLFVYETENKTRDNDDCECGTPSWVNWFSESGATATDINDPNTYNAASKYHGLRINISTQCDLDLCTGIKEAAFKYVLATAAAYKSALNILKAPSVASRMTPSTLTDKGQAQALIDQYMDEYQSSMIVLKTQHRHSGGCMQCNDPRGTVASLL